MKGKEIVIALAGNPNSGKTTIFNNLTGLKQHVGNYPGVTVEKRSGEIHYKDHLIKIVDLPGMMRVCRLQICFVWRYRLMKHDLGLLRAMWFLIKTVGRKI